MSDTGTPTGRVNRAFEREMAQHIAGDPDALGRVLALARELEALIAGTRREVSGRATTSETYALYVGGPGGGGGGTTVNGQAGGGGGRLGSVTERIGFYGGGGGCGDGA